MLAFVGLGGVAALRFAASWNDLWMDEIWPLHQVADLESWIEVLTLLREDNHTLYSMYCLALGPDPNPTLYRLPALLCGIATAPAAAWVGFQQAERNRRLASLLAGGAVGFSYLGVHLGSEARGYAPAVLFSIAAFGALLRWHDDARLRWRFAYAAAIVFAILAQPLAINFLIAAPIWTVSHLRRAGRGWIQCMRSAAGWHAAPLAAAALWYLFYLRLLKTGGGPLYPPSVIANDLFAYTFGLPAMVQVAWFAGIVVFSGMVWSLLDLRRSKPDLALFYLMVIFLAPLLIVILRRQPLLYERYFILNGVMALLLVSDRLANQWADSRGWRVAVSGVVAVFLIGNAAHAAELLRYGRGGYSAAARLIAEREREEAIRFSGDQDFRIEMVMTHHFRRVAPDRELQYVEPSMWPNWFISHSQIQPLPGVPMRIELPVGVYEHVATFPYARLSGWHSFVYRRVRAPTSESALRSDLVPEVEQ